MTNKPPQVEFHFINSSINSPIVPQDHAIRTLIRKQAMKKASAARKRNGSYGKHNLRQYPVFVVDQENATRDRDACAPKKESGHDIVHIQQINKPDTHAVIRKSHPNNGGNNSTKAEGKTAAERLRFHRRVLLTEKVPPNLSPKGYELTSMRCDFDILDLSTLATLHVGRAVRAALSQDPHILVHQLRAHERWSYLAFLPSRYEHTRCLRDATDCVIARIRSIMRPGENREAMVVSSYLKALDSLQKALDCPKTRFQPDVLCATEILALYELLDPTGERAWIRHAAGAAKLIQLRGPKSYNTDFEKALFIAQTFSITTECLLNADRCFLEQEEWQEVMRSVIVKKSEDSVISDRSEIVVTLLMNKCFIPGIALDVCNIVIANSTGSPPDPEFLESVIQRLYRSRKFFKEWQDRYWNILGGCDDVSPGSANHDSHCKVYANFIACLMVTSRLLAAISPKDRREAEGCAQKLALEMVQLENDVKSSPTWLFMAQTVIVARATRATAEEWRPKSETEDENYTDEKGLVSVGKLVQWAKMFGRRC